MNVVEPQQIYFNIEDPNPVYVFDISRVIEDKLEKAENPIDHSYATKCIPLYAQGLKETYMDQIITSFLDSPTHDRILSTVPAQQRPPIIIVNLLR